MLLSAEHISLNYGLKQLLDDVTLYIEQGDKIGVIGINGTGKSSLLRILAGKQVPDRGTVSLDPNVQVSFLSQDPDMEESLTVLEQVFAGYSPDVRELLESRQSYGLEYVFDGLVVGFRNSTIDIGGLYFDEFYTSEEDFALYRMK